METYKLVDNKEQKRYEYHIDGYRPHIEYRMKNGAIYLTHTRVPAELRGNGIATMLVKDVLKDISEKDIDLVPLCGFVASYIKKNPEWKSLLKKDIYIG